MQFLAEDLQPQLEMGQYPEEDLQLLPERVHLPEEDLQTQLEKVQSPGEDLRLQQEKVQHPGKDLQPLPEKVQYPGEDLELPPEKMQSPKDDLQLPQEMALLSENLPLREIPKAAESRLSERRSPREQDLHRPEDLLQQNRQMAVISLNFHREIPLNGIFPGFQSFPI